MPGASLEGHPGSRMDWEVAGSLLGRAVACQEAVAYVLGMAAASELLELTMTISCL